MSVLVVGSANMDVAFTCDRFPMPGETILGGAFAQHPGGKGANQAAAIACLGGDVTLLSAVGRDPFGDALLANLTRLGVNTSSMLVRDDVETGCAMILVDGHADNMIVVAPGANATLAPSDVQFVLSHKAFDIALVQLEIPMDCVAELVSSMRTILNPAPAQQIPAHVLQGLFAITPNQSEAEFLTGVRPVDEASCGMVARELLDAGVEHVVITLGAMGCYWNGHLIHGFEVGAVDTTGAGDAFNGALAWALSSGFEWPEALRWANATAALSTTRRGAQNAMPSREEVLELVAP
jgi:ribokinase